jgi:hypothetical protein
MLGGKIVGEGVDGCVLSEPMWPCSAAEPSSINSKDAHFVSKVVSVDDIETENLKMAARILGPTLSSRYIAGLQGECAPADKTHGPALKNANSYKSAERAVITWPKKAQACEALKYKLLKGKDLSKDNKIMFISKYDATVSSWIEKVQKPYKSVIREVEKAIPQLMIVLQKLYQGSEEQLIHIDLHSANITVRMLPSSIEFGLADFGRCLFRRNHVDPSKTFYGEFLIDYVSRNEFFCGYGQVPFEARLFNYCYRKKLESATPSALVKGWETDNTVRMDSAGSTDLIQVVRSTMCSYLLKRVLFIAMVEQIQSICKKIRLNPSDYLALYNSLNSTEKTVIEFILTRYSILSPLNTISEEIMNKYKDEKILDASGKGTNTLIRFLMSGMLCPYDQEGSSLVKALSAVQGADMAILWADAARLT